MKANEKILGFLIGSYTQMVKTFGKEQKTNDFFLLQMKNLQKIGQVSEKDAEIVTTVIGLKTAPFYWEKSQKRINDFATIMDILYGLDEKSKEIKLNTMYELGGIKKEMYDIIRSVYDLPDITKESKKSRSTLFRNFDKVTEISKPTNVDWESFKKNCSSDCLFHIKNPYAVCSTDRSYYDVKVKDLEQDEHFLKLLSKGASFEICVKEKYDDGCHTSYSYKIKKNLTEQAKKIDFKEVYENYFEMDEGIER